VERLKQTVEDVRIGSLGGGAAFHGRDDAVAIVGECRDHRSGYRRVDAGKVGDQHLHRNASWAVAGGKEKEHQWGNA
jgi:hypothetical protein